MARVTAIESSATSSNGRGIDPGNTSEDLQATYYADLTAWAEAEGILTFVFEAFDEPWKGSPDPLEPEKHWGLFTVDRRPKKVMQSMYPEPLYHSWTTLASGEAGGDGLAAPQPPDGGGSEPRPRRIPATQHETPLSVD